MDQPSKNMKRVTVRPNRPNPLFEQWLEEWQQEAASKGSDMQYCFGKALKSLRKYPLLLKSGKDCAVLDSFGNRLCQLLDRRLMDYRKTHPEGTVLEISSSSPPVSVETKKKQSQKKQNVTANESEAKAGVSGGTEHASRKICKKRGSGKEYVPAWRSGPYAILLTLLREEDRPDYCGYMTKEDLQRQAQPLCDTSFTRPNPGSYYTAWSSASLLYKKGLVNKFSNPVKFHLTDEGREIAKRLLQSGEDPQCDEGSAENLPAKIAKLCPSSVSHEGISATETSKEGTCKKTTILGPKVAVGTVTQQESSSSTSQDKLANMPFLKKQKLPCEDLSVKYTAHQLAGSSASEDMVILQPGQFDVFLLVDTAETTGASKRRYDQTISELKEMKVPFEVRRLKVGDFVWIARHHVSGDELLLPYIVERKRMDDFGGSVKDGRFHDQKFRLKQSGVEHLIYLVESYGSNQHVGLPLSSLQQAAVNTQVIDGFFVKHTTDHRHSMAYLASLTRLIGRIFLNKTLMSCAKKDLSSTNPDDDLCMLMTFQEFNRTTGKTRNFTVREMFIRQLLQLKGLSVDKALAIVGRYPTPQALVSAYRGGGDHQTLASIPYGAGNRCIGPVVSKTVYQLYTMGNS